MRGSVGRRRKLNEKKVQQRREEEELETSGTEIKRGGPRRTEQGGGSGNHGVVPGDGQEERRRKEKTTEGAHNILCDFKESRLVIGGHVIDSSKHSTYSSTEQDIPIRLLQLVALHNKLHIMTGNISITFCTVPVAEKIYTQAGPEFGNQQGCILVLKWAFYGLKTASRLFHEFFGNCLLQLGFAPTWANPDLWHRKSDDYEGYDYIATHVDDIIITAKRPAEYMSQIKQQFNLRNKEDSPSYYLGNSYKRDDKGNIHVSSTKYIKEVLQQFVKQHGKVQKQCIPMRTTEHPEMDQSPYLNAEEIQQFRHIIGVFQWIMVSGRFDINYAVSSLSRFAIAPRKHHLELV